MAGALIGAVVGGALGAAVAGSLLGAFVVPAPDAFEGGGVEAPDAALDAATGFVSCAPAGVALRADALSICCT